VDHRGRVAPPSNPLTAISKKTVTEHLALLGRRAAEQI
jgi:hypothetical protein